MDKILITGWKTGFNKVGFNQYLRRKHGLSIKDAKTITDKILNGERIELTILDLKSFSEVAESLHFKFEVKDK